MRKYIHFWFVLFLVLIITFNVFAAESVIGVPTVNFNELNKELNQMDIKIKSGTATIDYMSDSVQRIISVRKQLQEAKRELDKEVEYTQKKIDALGEQGEKETGVIAQKRKEFTNELAARKGKVAEVDILFARLDEMDTKILNLRSRELFGNLLDKQKALIYPTNFFQANKFLVSFLYEVVHSPVNWFDNLDKTKRIQVRNNIIPVLFIVLLSLMIGVYLRLFIMRHFGYRKEIDYPRYGKKVSAAICVAIAYGVIPASIIAGMLIWIASSSLITGYFSMVIGSFLYFCLYILLGRAVVRVVLTPYNERWRLVNVSNEKAFRLTSAFYGAINVIGIFGFLEYVSDKSNYTIDLSAYISTLGCFAKAFFVVIIVKRML